FRFVTGASDYPDLHSFPTRRSSDLGIAGMAVIGIVLRGAIVVRAVDRRERCRAHLRLRRRGGKIVGLEAPARIALDCLALGRIGDRKSTRLNSSHLGISYAVFCLKK